MKVLLLACLCLLGNVKCELTTLGELVKVQYDVLANGGGVNTSLTLTNSGAEDIYTENNVSVHVCFIRFIKGYEQRVGIDVGDATVYHVDGCAHKIVYPGPFSLAAGANLTIYLQQLNWMNAYTDVMPGWYIQDGENGTHQIIANTNTNDLQTFVGPFDTREKLQRWNWDDALPWSLTRRGEEFKYRFVEVDEDVRTRLVPKLMSSVDTTLLSLPTVRDWDVIVDPAAECSVDCIKVTVDETMKEDSFSWQTDVDANTVAVSAGPGAGTLYALDTLYQLADKLGGSLPSGSVSEAPRHSYRGFMLDIARNFRTATTIKKIIREMSFLKLNKLHLHLTDDEAWRLEIEGLPELTDVGARTCFDESRCVPPQLGHPISEPIYLSKTDYIELLKEADAASIEIIPEIDIPGHSDAAVRSMNVRWAQDPTEDYRLVEEGDPSVYFSVQGFSNNAMNPCLNSTYAFAEKVLDAVISYHEEAGVPLRVIHFGGDEVGEGAWLESEACQAYQPAPESADTLATVLKRRFIKRLGEIVSARNVSLGLWEDGLYDKASASTFPKAELFPEELEVIGFAWQNVWNWGQANRAYNMANAGYKVVLVPGTAYYLDHSQEPHPAERGYYWATRYINLRTTFSFRPDNFYGNIYGGGLKKQTFCSKRGACPPLNDDAQDNVIGVQGALFAETIRTADNAANNMFPRLLAIAERAWSKSDWEDADGEFPDGLMQDFHMFTEALSSYYLPKLHEQGFTYHISAPGVIATSDSCGELYNTTFITEFSHQKVMLHNMSGAAEEATDVTDQTLLWNRTLKLSTMDFERSSYVVEEATLEPMPCPTPTAASAVSLTISTALFILTSLLLLNI